MPVTRKKAIKVEKIDEDIIIVNNMSEMNDNSESQKHYTDLAPVNLADYTDENE